MYGFQNYAFEVEHLKHQSSLEKVKRRKQKRERRRRKRADEKRMKLEAGAPAISQVNPRLQDDVSRVPSTQNDQTKSDIFSMFIM